jgi:hypothetical protein
MDFARAVRVGESIVCRVCRGFFCLSPTVTNGRNTMRFRIGIILSLLLLTACGGGCGSNNNNNDNGGTKPPVSVKISPQPSADVVIGESTIFTVTTQNTGFDLAVVPSSGHGCSKSGNSVTCAPTAAGNYTLTVTASADTSKKETATLNVSAPEPEPEPAVTIVEPADGKLSLWADQTEATISFNADGPWTITVTDVSGGDKAAMSETAAIKDVKIAAAGLPDTPPPVCYPSIGDPDWVVVSVYDGVAGIWSLAVRFEPNYGQCDRTAEIKIDSKDREPVVFTIIQRGITMDGKPLEKKYDVYMPFGHYRKYVEQTSHPGYWKNGEKILLPLDSINASITGGNVTGLTVSGNDVYAIGNVIRDYTVEPGGAITSAVYWKNGEAALLPKTMTDSYASAITVEPGKNIGENPVVYIAGYEEDYNSTRNNLLGCSYQYWKDGVVYQLSKPTADCLDTSATVRPVDIAVHGSDVYVLGSDKPSKYTYANAFAGYWKNGVYTRLEPEGNYVVAAFDIAVAQNGDVYIAGFRSDKTFCPQDGCGTYEGEAILWKNGIPQKLDDDAVAQSVFIDGNDVYVAVQKYGGSDGVYYYKNNVKVSLGTDGARDYGRNALTVVDGDVYLSAQDLSSHYLGFWKNREKYEIYRSAGPDDHVIECENGDLNVVPHNPSRKW